MGIELRYNALLIRRQPVADRCLAVLEVELDAPLPREDDAPPFRPGQYLSVGLNDPDTATSPDPSFTLRPMCMASAPEHHPRRLELLVQAGGAESPPSLSRRLLGLEQGAPLHVCPAPNGHFLEPALASDGRRLLFVGAGTGIAPFMSFLRSRLARGESVADCALVHGAREPVFLAFRDELLALSRDHGLRYLPTVSRTFGREDREPWEGGRRRVEGLFGADRAEPTAAQLDLRIHPDETRVFVAGRTHTLRGMLRALAPRGYLPEHRRLRRRLFGDPTGGPAASLFSLAYDGEPMLDLSEDEGPRPGRLSLGEFASLYGGDRSPSFPAETGQVGSRP